MKTLTKKQQEAINKIGEILLDFTVDKVNDILYQVLANENDKIHLVVLNFVEGDKFDSTRFNSGFNVLELLGVLQFASRDILYSNADETKMHIKEVKRYYSKRKKDTK